jgi:hypothetical protein
LWSPTHLANGDIKPNTKACETRSGEEKLADQDKREGSQTSLIDILTGKQGAVIPKPHDLGFCFIATASTHKEFYGLMFAPQTLPR